MNSQPTKSHTLLIYDQPEPRQIFLNAATYSIGRDTQNGIVIAHKNISRQHALLLRMPLSRKGHYAYRILDGNSAGQPSLNGLLINGAKRLTWDLTPGDSILLGGAVLIRYQTIDIAAESKYFNYIKFQTPDKTGLKVRVMNSESTLVGIPNQQKIEALEKQKSLELEDLDDDSQFTELFG